MHFTMNTFATINLLMYLRLINGSHKHTQDYDWAGYGYSRDLQQLAHKKCFKVIKFPVTEQRLDAELGKPLSYFELESKLRLEVSGLGDYEMFSPGEKERFVSSLKEKSNTMSLNYYDLYADEIPLQIDGYGVEALNDFGRDTYKNDSNFFGQKCGDEYIFSYAQGMVLIMSLNLEFRNHWEKNLFESEGRGLFGNISEAVDKVRTLAVQHDIPGKMTVRAYQVGGVAEELFELLTTNFLTCNFNVLEKCKVTVDYLSRYAVDFKKQFQNKMNTVPLFTTNENPIDSIGLDFSPSFISEEKETIRKNFSVDLEKNQHYWQIIKSFLEWYPVNFAYQSLCEALKNADENLGQLMKADSGPAACFDMPNVCNTVKDNLKEKLKPVRPQCSSLLEKLKYILPIDQGIFYPTGEETAMWDFVPDGKYQLADKKININKTECNFSLRLNDKDSGESLGFKFQGSWDQKGERCHGTMCLDLNEENCDNKKTIEKQQSPFYFKEFNIKRDYS